MEESMSLTGQAQGVEKLCQTAQENVQGVEELCRAVQGNVQSPENQAGTEPGIQVASENQDWTRYLAAQFGLPQKEWTQYSPLTLAYIGDAVYEIVVRTVLVKRANTQTAKLHQKASALVKAGTQAEMIKALLPHLTEEEAGLTAGDIMRSHTIQQKTPAGGNTWKPPALRL